MYNPKRRFYPYPMRTRFTFSLALMLLKEGDLVQRHGWGDQHLALEKGPDTLILHTVPDGAVLWRPLQQDLLAEDWQLYDTRDRVREAAPFG